MEPGGAATLSLLDRKDFDLVVAEGDAIADRLADQSARDGRDVGDRSRSGIGFILPDDLECLAPPSSRANVAREPNATVWRSTGSGISCAVLRRSEKYRISLDDAATALRRSLRSSSVAPRDTRRERPP